MDPPIKDKFYIKVKKPKIKEYSYNTLPRIPINP